MDADGFQRAMGKRTSRRQTNLPPKPEQKLMSSFQLLEDVSKPVSVPQETTVFWDVNSTKIPSGESVEVKAHIQAMLGEKFHISGMINVFGDKEHA